MRPGVLFGALFLPLAAGATPIPATFPPSSKALPPAAPPAAPPPSPSASSSSKPDVAALLTGALPADGTADVVLIDWPGDAGNAARPRRDRRRRRRARRDQERAAGRRQLPQDRPRADPRGRLAHARPDCRRSAGRSRSRCSTSTGTLVIHERPDGAEIDLVDGDFSPGKLIFTATPRATGGGSTLLVDAQLNIQNAGWLIRRLVKLSPAGEPAALVAASYVTLRAVALRAENAGSMRRAPARGDAGAAAHLVAVGARRSPTRSWRRCARTARSRWWRAPGRSGWPASRSRRRWAFRRRTCSGGCAIRRAGTRSPAGGRSSRAPVRTALGAKVEDNLPFVDLEATWMAEPGNPLRWTATDGVITGARLGWEIYPIDPRANAGAPTLMALMMYPRLETTGRLARKAIASEPLLEHGLAVAVAFADLTAMKTALEAKR